MIKTTVRMLYKFIDHTPEELNQFVKRLNTYINKIEKMAGENIYFSYDGDDKQVQIDFLTTWSNREFEDIKPDLDEIVEFDYDAMLRTPRKLHDLIKYDGNLIKLNTRVLDSDWS